MGRRQEIGSELDGPFRGSAAVAAGFLTRGQLRGPGVLRLFRDVYVLAGTVVTHQLRCSAAALALPPEAVVTGRSAATVFGVSLARTWDPVELIVPLEARVTCRSGMDVRRTDLDDAEWLPWRGIGMANPDRAALDLLFDRPLPDAVADLDAVLRADLVTLGAMRTLVAGRHDRGVVAARKAVELADPGAESLPESKVRVRLRLAGLRPEVQHRVLDTRGCSVAIVDLAFPQRRLAVEYDGRWHGEWLQVGPDRERLNRLHAAGWEVVFVTAEMLRAPHRMVHTVRAALAARS